MKRVLLAGNDSVIFGSYQKKLVELGFDVVPADSAEIVSRKLLEESFDIVLLDVSLPGMADFSMLNEIRSNSAYSPDLKIIVLGNAYDREMHRKAIAIGANGFIAKVEYMPVQLASEVKRFVYQFEEQKKNSARFANANARAEESDLKRKKILLVEDEEVFVDIFGKRLQDEGYDVDFASNGVIGLKKAMENPFDLIVTDMVMPGMTGKELIEKLREAGNGTKVVLFSASVGDDEFEQMECDRVADRCFQKTKITPSELAYAVNDLLGE